MQSQELQRQESRGSNKMGWVRKWIASRDSQDTALLEKKSSAHDDDAFYLFLQKQKFALEPYTLPPGTHHLKKRKHTHVMMLPP